MEKRDFLPIIVGEIRGEHVPERLVLGENEYLFAVVAGIFHNLHKFFHLARAVMVSPQHGGSVAEEMRRVITNLFDFGQRCEHQAAPPYTLGLFQLGGEIIHVCGVEGGLFLGEVHGDDGFGFFGEIPNNGRVGFEPAQYKRRGKVAQLFLFFLIPGDFDGFGEVVFEK